MKIVSFHTTFFIAILLSASHGGVRVSSKPRSSRTAAYRKRATRQGDEEFIQKNVHVGHGRDVYEKSPQGNSFEDGYFRSDSTFNNWEHGDRYGGDGISYNKKYETRSGRKSFSKEAVHVLKYTESLPSKVLVAIASGSYMQSRHGISSFFCCSSASFALISLYSAGMICSDWNSAAFKLYSLDDNIIVASVFFARIRNIGCFEYLHEWRFRRIFPCPRSVYHIDDVEGKSLSLPAEIC